MFAKILQTDVFSAHPDTIGLQDYFKASDSNELKKVFFVHGEEEAMYDLKNVLSSDFQEKVEIPGRGEEYYL